MGLPFPFLALDAEYVEKGPASYQRTKASWSVNWSALFAGLAFATFCAECLEFLWRVYATDRDAVRAAFGLATIAVAGAVAGWVAGAGPQTAAVLLGLLVLPGVIIAITWRVERVAGIAVACAVAAGALAWSLRLYWIAARGPDRSSIDGLTSVLQFVSTLAIYFVPIAALVKSRGWRRNRRRMGGA